MWCGVVGFKVFSFKCVSEYLSAMSPIRKSQKEALAVRERETFPQVSLAVDRRSFEYTCAVFNDARIKALVCFACARIQLDTGGVRSRISMYSGDWLLNLPEGSLKKSFPMDLFSKRYRKSGSPLAFFGNNHRNADGLAGMAAPRCTRGSRTCCRPGRNSFDLLPRRPSV